MQYLKSSLDDLLIQIKRVDLRLKRYLFPIIDQSIAPVFALTCKRAGLPRRKIHFTELSLFCNIFVIISIDP